MGNFPLPKTIQDKDLSETKKGYVLYICTLIYTTPTCLQSLQSICICP